MRYALPVPPEAPWEKAAKFGLIVAAHALLVGLLATTFVRPQMLDAVVNLDLRVLEEKPNTPEPEKPKPVRPSTPPPVEPLPEPPVMTAAAEAPAQSAFSVPEQPAPAAPPAPIAEPLIAARFDADYLHNPAPSYPPASRRFGEEGKVMLRVLVGSDGSSEAVQVQKSSGFPRLDEAACSAVRHWRFVAARRGGESVEDWVLIPIVFRLER